MIGEIAISSEIKQSIVKFHKSGKSIKCSMNPSYLELARIIRKNLSDSKIPVLSITRFFELYDRGLIAFWRRNAPY